jgi:hypothetical protein
MKPSEILRGLADALDAKEKMMRPISMAGALSPRIMPKPMMPSVVDVEVEPDCGCDDSEELAQQPDDIFVPPLQLKLELLKKATGVENIYDTHADEEDNGPVEYPGDQLHPDDYLALEKIKRNAGISPVVLDALGDDEPLDV